MSNDNLPMSGVPADRDSEADQNSGSSSRRALLAGSVIGGAAIVGGLAGGGAAVAAGGGGWKRTNLRFDVACIGETWRDAVTRNPADEGDFRAAFIVEGLLYPEGTVTDGFVPTTDDAIGHWFCQGWALVDGVREEPHVSSSQRYHFGMITSDRLFPPDMLVSEGLEGTADDSQPPIRVVGGGTGEYLGASGAMLQHARGVNTTVLADGSDANALNFSFDVDLLLPDL